MDDIIIALKALLAAAMGTTYTYYYGENKVPADADLPLIEVIPVGTSMEVSGTGGQRRFEHTIHIGVKLRLQDYVQENTNVTTVAHVQDLVKIMEERNSNGTLKSATILGVLSENLQLSPTAKIAKITNKHDVSYDVTPAQGGKWLIHARLELSILQLIP